jgi:3-oxoacyl-[acyl-carrier protein] reductase
MTAPLAGQTALVTGGSRGIGHAIARRLGAAGAEVVLTARTAAAAEAAAAGIVEAGGRARGVELEVTDLASVERVVAETAREGRLSILVNNAGLTRDALLLRMKHEDWNTVLDTDLTSIYHLCRAALSPMLRARYGRIVNITSVVAALGNPGQANYAAAKAGVEGFTRSLAREIASRNITANCVAPGFIDTDMTRSLADTARARLVEQIPLNRLGQPDDVAGAVLYLVGPDASYVTGVTLNVNGGMHMG